MVKNNVAQRSSLGAYATILGAVVTIGAVVLSNKEVRNKALKLISVGIDKLTTDDTGGIKDHLSKTVKKVEGNARTTMQKMKDTVHELTDNGGKTPRKAVAAR